MFCHPAFLQFLIAAIFFVTDCKELKLAKAAEITGKLFQFLNLMGHLHDGVILLPWPESFSFFLWYLNLIIPARFKWQKP